MPYPSRPVLTPLSEEVGANPAQASAGGERDRGAVEAAAAEAAQ